MLDILDLSTPQKIPASFYPSQEFSLCLFYCARGFTVTGLVQLVYLMLGIQAFWWCHVLFLGLFVFCTLKLFFFWCLKVFCRLCHACENFVSFDIWSFILVLLMLQQIEICMPCCCENTSAIKLWIGFGWTLPYNVFRWKHKTAFGCLSTQGRRLRCPKMEQYKNLFQSVKIWNHATFLKWACTLRLWSTAMREGKCLYT